MVKPIELHPRSPWKLYGFRGWNCSNAKRYDDVVYLGNFLYDGFCYECPEGSNLFDWLRDVWNIDCKVENGVLMDISEDSTGITLLKLAQFSHKGYTAAL